MICFYGSLSVARDDVRVYLLVLFSCAAPIEGDDGHCEDNHKWVFMTVLWSDFAGGLWYNHCMIDKCCTF